MSAETKPKDDYLLSRSYSGSARLNLQHYMWVQGFGGNLLDPSIPNQNEPGLKIADVGTGNGIWTMDMSSKVPPSTQLEGLDISLGQVPPKEWWPANVTFKTHDVFEEPPEDRLNYYDIIYIRHFNLVAKNDDPTPILKNILKMTKPGGWIQWGEFDLINRQLVTAKPNGPTKGLRAAQEAGKKFLHTPTATWMGHLGRFFDGQAMQNVKSDKIWFDQAYLSYSQDVHLQVYEEIINMIAQKPDVKAEDVEGFRETLQEVAREQREGSVWNIPRIQVVGQKPS